MKLFFLFALLAVLSAKVLSPKLADHTAMDAFFKKHEILVVDFVSEKCQTCQQWAPVFDHLEAEFADKKSHVEFAKIDCESSESIGQACHALNITSFPTVMYIKKGKPLAIYHGDLSLNNVSKWIDTMFSHKPYYTVSNASDYAHYTKEILPTLDYQGTLFVVNGNVTNNNVTAFLDAKHNSLPVIMVTNQTIANSILGGNTTKGDLYAVRGGSPYVIFKLLTIKDDLNPHIIGRAFTVANRPYNAQLDAPNLYSSVFIAERANEPLVILGTQVNATQENFNDIVNLSRILNPLTCISLVLETPHNQTSIFKTEIANLKSPYAVIFNLKKGSYLLSLNGSAKVGDLAETIYSTIDKLENGKLEYSS